MNATVHGIHHVTAIAGNAQENQAFYVGVMGMRLVKKSVNQDDPSTYHLFYADGAGTPGTDLTFFPWSVGRQARMGTGLTVEVSLSTPPGSLDYWQERFDRMDVSYGAVETRFGEPTLSVVDPHGLWLALVETEDERAWVPWQESPVPLEYQIRGLHSVRLWERELGPTVALLTEIMGLQAMGDDYGWHRYGVDDGAPGKLIDLQALPHESPGRWGIGGIHHVAWRVQDDAEEMALRQKLEAAGLSPTPQIDRFWFKSVYFSEPGRAIFELATDGPGFDRDEDPAHLGEQLILPPWLEPRRAEIEAALPALPPISSEAPLDRS